MTELKCQLVFHGCLGGSLVAAVACFISPEQALRFLGGYLIGIAVYQIVSRLIGAIQL